MGLSRYGTHPTAAYAKPDSREHHVRAKEYLESELTTPIRLPQIADAVGSSSAYLTDVFRRFAGVSLQRYVTQLRLARALAELPHTEDLTTLALDLGFSSHSHFTFAFRRAFACTPSEFRLTARRRKSISALVSTIEKL